MKRGSEPNDLYINVSVSPNVMQHCMKTAFPPFKTAETLFVFPGGPGKL